VGTRDGVVRWSLPLQGVPIGEPLVVGGQVAVPNSEGLLFIEASTGRLQRVFDPGTGVSAAPAGQGRRVYVLSNAGDLLALDLT
jgi:hypothetical protein